MSGGAFEYKQYQIDDIVGRIEQEIIDATKPRPKTHTVKYVTVYKTISEHCSRGVHNHPFARLTDLDEVRQIINKSEWIKVLEDREDKIYFEEYGEKYYVYAGQYEEYPPETDENGCTIYPYYPDYTPETLQEFRKAVEILKQASVYAHRVDWLISGDDGEETFHERLKEDLAKITKKK